MITRRDVIVRAPLAAAATAFGLSRAGRAGAATTAANPLACQTNAWQIKQGDFAELLARVADLKRLGFEAFECNVRFVKDLFADSKKARAQIDQTGVRFYGSHVALRFPMDDLFAWVDGAASLGATRFALSGAGKLPTHDGKLDQNALVKKVESIMRLAKRCSGAGLRLVYHNHAQEFANRGQEMEALLHKTDPALVYMLLDIGHANLAGADATDFFTRHQHRIDALHLRDIKGGKQVPMGQGDFDFTALAAAIRKTNWPGYLTLEEENLKSNDAHYVETVLRSSRQVIRKAFGV